MIVGAGLAGLIAAHVFPNEPIIDAAKEPNGRHKALLRFRSSVVSDLTGIEFTKVTVRKAISVGGSLVRPDINVANKYSRKVLGVLADRSIWNLDPVVRYIAPEDFYERLIDAVGHRVQWGVKADFAGARSDVISTAPMPLALSALGIDSGLEFRHKPVLVRQYRIQFPADVHQTIYFPTFVHHLYRASIVGNLLICEFTAPPVDDGWLTELQHAFALPPGFGELISETTQDRGKIDAVDEHTRRALVARLTQDHNIYSLGRFATWRNILLDDVVHDAHVIKQLRLASTYDRKLKGIK